jgi:acetyltransferase-like isoleucine patch superfamily enzyme
VNWRVRFKTLKSLSPSQRRRALSLMVARSITRLLHKPALKQCGERNIISRPASVTWEYVSLGNDCYIGPGCRIEGVARYADARYEPDIRFGDRVSAEQRCTIVAASTLIIGRNTTISHDVMITDLDHEHEAIGIHVLSQPIRVRRTSIGENCFIGSGAKILAGTTLGYQCIVGANAVVRGEFESFSVLIGNPAKVTKRYDSDSRTWRTTDSAGTVQK